MILMFVKCNYFTHLDIVFAAALGEVEKRLWEYGCMGVWEGIYLIEEIPSSYNPYSHILIFPYP